MALMHCCCFCCTPKSGSLTIGVLQLLSHFIGAGIVGLILTGINYIQEDSRLIDILQDFFEVDLNTAQINAQLDELQAVLEKRTRIVERVLYGMLGYIAVDFIFTCFMIHGARTNGGKLLVPWILLNGLRAVSSLASGIYMVMKRTQWAEDLSTELNDVINNTIARSNGREELQHVDPAMLETTLTSSAGVLIVGSIVSLYFVLVVYSQFQIIRHNRAQTKLVQRRVSMVPAGTLSPSASFHHNIGNGGGNPSVTQIPMVPMSNTGYFGAEAYDNPAYTPNAPPATQHMVSTKQQQAYHTSNGYGNDFSSSQRGYYPNPHQFNTAGLEQRRRSQLHPDIVTSNGNRPHTGVGFGNWQAPKGNFYPEPAPDYD